MASSVLGETEIAERAQHGGTEKRRLTGLLRRSASGGQIEIDFGSQEDLQRLFGILTDGE